MQDPISFHFTIHHFRISTETNLANKLLADTDRKYIIQTLAAVLMILTLRASMKDCQVRNRKVYTMLLLQRLYLHKTHDYMHVSLTGKSKW